MDPMIKTMQPSFLIIKTDLNSLSNWEARCQGWKGP